MTADDEEEMMDEIRACIVDKKNPARCIDAVLEDHNIKKTDKEKILTMVIKDDNE
jgi:hypothetical protein